MMTDLMNRKLQIGDVCIRGEKSRLNYYIVTKISNTLKRVELIHINKGIFNKIIKEHNTITIKSYIKNRPKNWTVTPETSLFKLFNYKKFKELIKE